MYSLPPYEERVQTHPFVSFDKIRFGGYFHMEDNYHSFSDFVRDVTFYREGSHYYVGQ